MNEFIIKEDRIRLLIYTILNLLLSIILLILASGFFSYGAFLLAFFTITGIWFSIKAMCKYGSKWIKKTPVCAFNKNELIIYSLPGSPKKMKYREIREVKILRNGKSVKLFFSGDSVSHPSGWYYAGVIYPFQRSLLDTIERESRTCLEKHNVNVRKVEC